MPAPPIKTSSLRHTLLPMALVACALYPLFAARADLPATNSVETATNAPSLDAKHLYALGAIETGNNDREVGAAGEISRFQISPAVWKSYSESTNYQDTKTAEAVARMHWNFLAKYFTEKTGRAPDDFDMYVMWNTRLRYYARKEISPRNISPVGRDRAQRDRKS